MMEKSRVHLKVRGRVQGVFFRASTEHEASRLGLKGWVKNCPDGSVEIVAEGEDSTLDELIHWCRKGPSRAQVIQVDQEKSDYLGEFENFEIR
jgi:acylphosphatase